MTPWQVSSSPLHCSSLHQRSRCKNANVATAKTDTASLPAPTGLTASAASSTQVNLRWVDNSTNETGFNIERSADNVTYTDLATVAAGVTVYQDTVATPGTKYYNRPQGMGVRHVSQYVEFHLWKRQGRFARRLSCRQSRSTEIIRRPDENRT
jgi:hypothetical protein